MALPVVLVTAAAPAVWGSTYVVTTTLLPDGRPLLAGALRALPAGLLLLAVTRTLPSGSWWWRSAVLGTLNIGAFFALLFVSAYRLPGGVAAVLGAVGPLLVVALSAALLAERATRRSVTSALVAAAGVTLTVVTADARLDGWGVAAGLGGAASMALGLVLTRRWGRPAPALTTTAWQLTAGGLVLLPLALLVEGRPPALAPSAVGGYAYLCLVGSALAYTLWFRGLERLPTASVSLLGQLSPVVAAALGWAVLDQRLTPVQLLGMVVALAGVVAGQPPASSQQVRRGGRSVPGQQELAARDLGGGGVQHPDARAVGDAERPQRQHHGRVVGAGDVHEDALVGVLAQERRRAVADGHPAQPAAAQRHVLGPQRGPGAVGLQRRLVPVVAAAPRERRAGAATATRGAGARDVVRVQLQ